MSTWNIYHKDGSKLTDVNSEQIIVHGLEYSDSWKGECYVTINFKNNAPIDFRIGDYLVYRIERFELNYEPGKDKQARKDTYGEGFVYDSVKFNAMQDELSRAEFLDVVLHDNELHYTALPKFSFYVETLDDLLDRIQANLNEQIGEGEWKIFSRSMERSVQRGVTKAEWNAAYGEKTTNDVIDSKSITIDSKKCWEALALVNSEWNVNFIVRGRNIYVGTAGVVASHIFKYGLGEGLYEIEQNADSEQQVITRLRAYGSEKNLPSHYYADLGVKYKASITSVDIAVYDRYDYVSFSLDLDYIETYFKTPRTYNNGKDSGGFVLQVTFDFKTVITGYVRAITSDKKCLFYSEVRGKDNDTGDEPSKANLYAFISQLREGRTLLYIVSGLNTKNIPSKHKEYAKNLPNNMSINRLMLPGFPHVSLQEYYDSLSEAEKKYVNPSGREHKFSTDPHRPYIDSINIDKIGLRSESQLFDQDDKTNGIVEIYPTIEEMVINDVRIDEINEGVAPDDDGRYDDSTDGPANIDIYLSPSIDFDINDLKDSDFAISMKDGYCGGRTFNVASSTKVDGRWRLTIERVKDDALDLYFPYKDYPINKGDHFVLTGITLPDSYVKAASLKLLKYAIALLDKNDYTRYVYQPKVDEIFMARQNDQANADETGTIKSLYQTLKAGDLMDFKDTDLNIEGQITIDQLTIKEEDGKIPTYEVTLREDKEVGTIQKIQQQISSLESGNGGSGAGMTVSQVKSQIAAEGSKYYLSKLSDDVSQGLITFLKGVKIGKNGKGLDKDGNGILGDVTMEDVVVDRIHDKNSTPSNRVIVGAQGFDLYMGEDGKSHLYVDYLTTRTKFFAAASEVRKISYSGGTTIFSNAGSTIVKVSYIFDSSGKNVIAYKCYATADDGTTRTMNWWHVGMMALCQTFNVKAGIKDESLSNRYYWRLVIGVGQEILDDGKLYDFVVLSNMKSFQGNLSVLPKYSDRKLADGNSNVLKFGNIMVAVTMYNGLASMSEIFEEQEGFTVDSGGTKVSDRIFYGYEPNEDGGEPDAPQPYDVIVQAGDQIQWKKYGNVIKLATSTEDGETDNAPSFSMYHSMGAPYSTGSKDSDGNDIINPFQWKTMTQLLSPEMELHNAANFKFFTDSPDNLIDPITVYYEIVPSSQTLIRHPATKTATPSDITFELVKHTGNKVETVPTGNYLFVASGRNAPGDTFQGTLFKSSLLEITKYFPSIYAVEEFNVQCYDIKHLVGKPLASFSLPVLTDGIDGVDGKSALEVTVSPDTLVFDTDSNGKVSDTESHIASIVCKLKGKNVTSECHFSVYQTKNCKASITFTPDNSSCLVTVSGITSQTVKVNTEDVAVSNTSGYAVVTFEHDGVAYNAQVNFSVNVSKFSASLVADNKQMSIRYTEISNALDDVPIKTDDELSQYTSSIEQSARNISLQVTQESLKGAGMEITSSGVTLYGDKILVKNGSATAALFTGGKLNATLIDADKIEVKHLWAKSEDGNTKVGYFGNYEVDEAKDDNDVLYPLWVGAGEAKDAPFRVSEKGHLTTTSATLGTWTLKAGLLEYDTGYEGADPGMALTNNNLIFREYTSHTHVRKRMVWIGDYTPSGNIPIIQSNICIEDKFSAEYYDEIKTGLRVSIEGCNDSLQYSDANYNGEKGSAVFGNFAIYAEKGMYAGLRPMSRTISRSCAITDMDFFIHVDGGSGQTFALPASPQRGQMYWFLHSQAGNFKINGNGKNLYAPAAGNPAGTLTFNTPGELLIVWFDGNIWRVVWTKGQWN